MHACSVAPVMSESYDPKCCSLPGSSVHGILQARILEWPWMGMATHSSILAWRIPWTEEPSGGAYSPQGC